MNNSNYSSLTEQLMQNGIIKTSEANQKDENFFEVACNDDVVQSPIESKIPKALRKESKRLNKSDYEMVSENVSSQNSTDKFRVIKRYLNIKQNLATNGSLGRFESFLFAFFPKLYKAKLAKDAMEKFKKLNIDMQKLHDKTIPYGENEMRYQDLIKYLSCANEIQTDIRRKTN